MKVLMVYPEFPETFWSYKHALKFIGKRALLPPLGLLTVAALLPKDWQLRLIDMNVRPLRPKDLAWADLVFLSAMAIQEPSARTVLTLCQKMGVKVAAGGPLFTSQRESFPDVNHLILNEGELTVPHFLADLSAGHPQRLYTTTEFADMQRSPIPRFELAELKQYAQMPIQYSRGCPFDCDFCDVTAQLGRKPRHKSVDQILAELNSLHRLRWNDSIFFVDDNLIGNKAHLKFQVLPALIDWQKKHGPIIFNTQASINLADDPELLDLMARAGFNSVFIGIETPDKSSLLECHKGQNVNRDLLADVRKIHQAGIQVQGGFIVGFDHDKPTIFQRQVEFIQNSGIVTAMVGLLHAIRGTRLYERLQREHRITAEFNGDNVAQLSNVVPVMDPDSLRKGYGYVLRTLYSPQGYYSRLREFLSHYRTPPVRSRLGLIDIKALFQSMLMLGVLGRERFQYWRLLLWTILHRPGLFALAVQLAVLGQHYRRVCRTYLRGCLQEDINAV